MNDSKIKIHNINEQICENCIHASATATYCLLYDMETDYDESCGSHEFPKEYSDCTQTMLCHDCDSLMDVTDIRIVNCPECDSLNVYLNMLVINNEKK